MLQEVNKLGSGTVDDPYRPDTSSDNWVLIEDKQTTFIIKIID